MIEPASNSISHPLSSTDDWLSSNERTAEAFEAIEVIISAAGQGKSMKRVLRRMAASAPHDFSVTFIFAWEESFAPPMPDGAFRTWIYGRAAVQGTLLGNLESLTEPCVLMTRHAIAMCEASPDPRIAISGLLSLQQKLSRTFEDLSKAISAVVHQQIPQIEPTYTRVDWIWKSNDLYRSGRKEEALDLIFDAIDDMLLASKFRECDSALSRISVDDLSNSQLLTVLTATIAARDRLPFRKALLNRAKLELERRGADAPRLLAGLE
jgi:hypothetical protein